LVCYIRKDVIILGGDIPVDVPPNQNIGGGCVPGIPGGVDASGPTFSLVYATPLLQHQDQFGLNPSLPGYLLPHKLPFSGSKK